MGKTSKNRTIRIVLDLYGARNPSTGIGEFCHQLARRIADRASTLKEQHGVHLYFILPYRMKGFYGDHVQYIALGGFPQRQLMPFYPKRIDLFHATHQFAHVKHMFFARHNLLTVHDINFMIEKHGLIREKYIYRFRKKLQSVTHLNFISEFTRNDVLTHFDINKPFEVIYNGVTDLSGTPPCDMGKFGLPPTFLLHISSTEPKKNVHLLVEMMRFLPEKNLVIVGRWRNEYSIWIKHHIKKLSLKNIFCLDNVSTREKAALFAQCEGFLFPSLCEGFGLPPVEAMLMGKPAFLSCHTSLPEIGGDTAYYWNELEPEKMAAVVTAGLHDFWSDAGKARATAEWAQRFNWEQCADQYIAYYLRILGLVSATHVSYEQDGISE